MKLEERDTAEVERGSRERREIGADNRYASTEPVTPAENISILNSQREKRPMSPHLAIYEKQVSLSPSSHRLSLHSHRHKSE